MRRGRENLPRRRCPARMRVVPPAGRMPPELQQRSQRTAHRHDPSAFWRARRSGGWWGRRGEVRPSRHGGMHAVRISERPAPRRLRYGRGRCQRMPGRQKPAGGRMMPPYRYGEGVHAAGRHGAGHSSCLWASCSVRSPNRLFGCQGTGLRRGTPGP